MNDQLTATNELHILGEQNIAGYEFTGIEGGFGEGKKAMLVKEIAVIHGQELKEINRRINDNIQRFKNGIDIIDLLGVGLSHTEIKGFGFSQQAINSYVGLKNKGLRAGIYLLSERGYSKLLKILEDDTAWDLYEKFVDGYFNMREQKQQPTMEDAIIYSMTELKQIKDRQSHTETELSKVKLLVDNEVWLTEPQKESVQRRVKRRVFELKEEGYNNGSHQAIYGALRKHFGVTKYYKIPRKFYQNAMKLVNGWYPPQRPDLFNGEEI